MHARDHACGVGHFIPDEEHAVREASDKRTPDREIGLSMLLWKPRWRFPNDADRRFYRIEESIAEASRAGLIPCVPTMHVR